MNPDTKIPYQELSPKGVPKSLHARLQSRARLEGASINTLAIIYITEGLSRKAA